MYTARFATIFGPLKYFAARPVGGAHACAEGVTPLCLIRTCRRLGNTWERPSDEKLSMPVTAGKVAPFNVCLPLTPGAPKFTLTRSAYVAFGHVWWCAPPFTNFWIRGWPGFPALERERRSFAVSASSSSVSARRLFQPARRLFQQARRLFQLVVCFSSSSVSARRLFQLARRLFQLVVCFSKLVVCFSSSSVSARRLFQLVLVVCFSKLVVCFSKLVVCFSKLVVCVLARRLFQQARRLFQPARCLFQQARRLFKLVVCLSSTSFTASGGTTSAFGRGTLGGGRGSKQQRMQFRRIVLGHGLKGTCGMWTRRDECDLPEWRFRRFRVIKAKVRQKAVTQATGYVEPYLDV
ncbi:hypothetical protein Bbelb_112180 [Branchiostoma belcheri]|nr:hypothetical protein Bbelb_112180 [Branchiostoma belcheri]